MIRTDTHKFSRINLAGLALLVLCISSANSVQAQGPVLNPANGHYYELIPGPITWDAAKATAESRTYLGLPGHLATITSAEENSFIHSNLIITDDNGAWTGGFQPNQGSGLAPDESWQWVTGEQWSYTNWHPSEPNDFQRPEWVTVIRSDGYWNDLYGTYFHPGGYVVEYESDDSGPGCGEDVTSRVRISPSGFRWVPYTNYWFSQNIVVTNISSEPVQGPLYIVLKGLPSSNQFLLGNQLITRCLSPNGDYLIPLPLLGDALQPGERVGVPLVFVSNTAFSPAYSPRVLSGTINN